MPRPNAPTGFTLVELLVVVSIIVVLLALLVPSLEKAIYRAELLLCAGNQRAVASAVHQYAFDHKRLYPYRNILDRQGGGQITPGLLANHIVDNSGRSYDIRPQLRGYIRINKQLNDPFVLPVDLDYVEAVPSTIVSSSYGMYFGWTFRHAARGGPGMNKLGDRWTWDGRRHGLLLGDFELLWDPANISSGHPDVGGGSPILVTSSGERIPVPIYLGNATQSYWISRSRDRGLLDMNYTYEDGSVGQENGVSVEDSRLAPTPYYYNGNNAATFRVFVPRN